MHLLPVLVLAKTAAFVAVPRRLAAPGRLSAPEHARAAPLDPPRTTAERSLAPYLAILPTPAASFLRQHWARLAILGCAGIYGTNFATVKTLDGSLPASLSASLRFGLASVAAVPVLYDAAREWDWSPEATGGARKLARGAVLIGAANAGGYVSQSIGLESVDASLSAFVCSLAVVVVPLLDAVLGKQRAAASTWAGVAISIAGVGLLSAHSLSTAGPSSATGLAFTLFQPLCFGFGFWKTERLLRDVAECGVDDLEACEVVKPRPGDDLMKASLACAAFQLIAVKAAADCWLCVEMSGGLDPATVSWADAGPAVAAAVVWTGIVTTFGTVIVETMALSKISAQESTVLFSTEPLWGAGFAALTLGERFDECSALGGFLVVAACLLSSLGGGDDDLMDFIDV